MNGHLQLSVSLKNIPEIKAAIVLLTQLLPRGETLDWAKEEMGRHFDKYYDSKFYAVSPASKGDLVKLSTEPRKPISNYKEVQKDVHGIKQFKPIPDAVRNKIRLKQKQRAAALKRKRDKHGHFLKEKK